MNTYRLKVLVTVIMMLPLLAVLVLRTNETRVSAVSNDDEATIATYKTKCGACHGPTALKFYDPEMAMEEQVEAIMKGKKGEKPPFMPGFESKGVTAEQALALAEYMKALRTPAQ